MIEKKNNPYGFHPNSIYISYVEPESHRIIASGRRCGKTAMMTEYLKTVIHNLQEDQDNKPGYHLTEITKGEIGTLSKIQEELDELKDAEEQGVAILALVELSDLYGAIDSYLEVNFPDTSMEDLSDMSNVTKRAFKNGRR